MRLGTLMAIALLANETSYNLRSVKTVQHKKQKQCALKGCDNLHTHNNSFCSPECCKAHKESGE